MGFIYALGWALAQFFSLLVLQFIWWRLQPPRRHTRALIYLFLALALASAPYQLSFYLEGQMELGQIVHAFVLYAALFAAYLITYSAIEVDSPSLLIVQKVAHAGKEGLSAETLRKDLGDDTLLIPRVEDLIRDKMLIGSPQRYELTGKGQKFIRIFILYRNLLKRKLGG